MSINIAPLHTPLGTLSVVECDGRITRVLWHAYDQGQVSDVLSNALAQLDEFFAGTRDVFELPLAPAGTPFQQRVYLAMQRIRKGHTRTYGEIAKELDVAAQPVGQACGSNPIPIIIPCHRVVASNGLGGFSAPGGIETKVALLRFEGAYSLLI